MKLFDGYFKKDIDNNVLLSKGGNKALSDFIGSLYFDNETNTLQYKSAIDTNYTDLFQLGARAFDSTEYLPLSGGTITGIITGNTGNGIEFLSANTGSWKEGIRIYPASNGYAVCSCQSKDSRQVLSLVMNESSGARYIDNCINGTTYAINIPHKSGTLALTSDITGTFMSKGYFTTTDTTTPGWGTLTSGNGYTGILYCITSGSGAVAFCQKPGGGDNLISMQIDGYFYQYDGQRRVLDVSDNPFLGSPYWYTWSSWNWNPFGANQTWLNGYSMYKSDWSGDTGDLRFYLSTSPPGCGGLGLCMNIDGYISTLSLMYAGNGFYTGSDIRLKKNIKNIDDINMLPVRLFDLKSNNLHSYGFIALELELLGLKELVINGNPYKSVNYNAALSLCIALLLNIIKNMEKRIKTLEANQAPPKV